MAKRIGLNRFVEMFGWSVLSFISLTIRTSPKNLSRRSPMSQDSAHAA